MVGAGVTRRDELASSRAFVTGILTANSRTPVAPQFPVYAWAKSNATANGILAAIEPRIVTAEAGNVNELVQ